MFGLTGTERHAGEGKWNFQLDNIKYIASVLVCTEEIGLVKTVFYKLFFWYDLALIISKEVQKNIYKFLQRQSAKIC